MSKKEGIIIFINKEHYELLQQFLFDHGIGWERDTSGRFGIRSSKSFYTSGYIRVLYDKDAIAGRGSTKFYREEGCRRFANYDVVDYRVNKEVDI